MLLGADYRHRARARSRRTERQSRPSPASRRRRFAASSRTPGLDGLPGGDTLGEGAVRQGGDLHPVPATRHAHSPHDAKRASPRSPSFACGRRTSAVVNTVQATAPCVGACYDVHGLAGVAQLVERQPSKLNVVGSSPSTRLMKRPLAGPFSLIRRICVTQTRIKHWQSAPNPPRRETPAVSVRLIREWAPRRVQRPGPVTTASIRSTSRDGTKSIRLSRSKEATPQGWRGRVLLPALVCR